MRSIHVEWRYANSIETRISYSKFLIESLDNLMISPPTLPLQFYNYLAKNRSITKTIFQMIYLKLAWVIALYTEITLPASVKGERNVEKNM